MNQFDPDAGAFINATGIGGIEAVAINNLVNQLKSVDIWRKLQIAYPLVGTTSFTQKFNLVNPVDSTAANALTFVGSGTHSRDGYQTNGTNAYANTNRLGTAIGSSNTNVHVSAFVKNIVGEDGQDFGCRNGNDWLGGNIRRADNFMIGRAFNGTATAYSQTEATGLMIISRGASANYTVRFNNNTNTDTQTALNRPAFNMVFGAYNDIGNISLFQSRLWQWFSCGTFLDATDQTNLVNIVTTFQNTIQR